jgi:hypothetical protein
MIFKVRRSLRKRPSFRGSQVEFLAAEKQNPQLVKILSGALLKNRGIDRVPLSAPPFLFFLPFHSKK